jgi:hypothetical protein
MAARDRIHAAVKNALIKDGWEVTHDPLAVTYEDTVVFVDLGAEQIIGAERNGRKIAVEIKSFLSRSSVNDLEVALGQYILYTSLLAVVEPARRLYLAVSDYVYASIFQRKAITYVLEHNQIPLIVVSLSQEEIIEWIR